MRRNDGQIFGASQFAIASPSVDHTAVTNTPPGHEGEKFDPYGAYVRRWVPELAPGLIHRTWSATEVEFGKAYPAPIVDHSQGRERALQAYATVRGR